MYNISNPIPNLPWRAFSYPSFTHISNYNLHLVVKMKGCHAVKERFVLSPLKTIYHGPVSPQTISCKTYPIRPPADRRLHRLDRTTLEDGTVSSLH